MGKKTQRPVSRDADLEKKGSVPISYKTQKATIKKNLSEYEYISISLLQVFI